MTRARDIANLVDANGDIVAGALDNVPAADVVNDTTPQLGGNLDLNGSGINGSGSIDIGVTGNSTFTSTGTFAGLQVKSTQYTDLELQDTNNQYAYILSNRGNEHFEILQADDSSGSRVFSPNGFVPFRIDNTGLVLSNKYHGQVDYLPSAWSYSVSNAPTGKVAYTYNLTLAHRCLVCVSSAGHIMQTNNPSHVIVGFNGDRTGQGQYPNYKGFFYRSQSSDTSWAGFSTTRFKVLNAGTHAIELVLTGDGSTGTVSANGSAMHISFIQV